MTNRAEAIAQDAALEIRFGPVDMAQVRLRTLDPGVIVDELTGKVATAPKFFNRAAVCLDLGALAQPPEPAELRAAIEAVRRAGMLPVGLIAGGATGTLASATDMPLLTPFRASKPAPVVQAAPAPQDATTPQPSRPAAPEVPVAHAAPAARPAPAASSPASAPESGAEVPAPLIHTQPVRSGQRLYARRRDLIVMATAGAGSELMADGCVHVYGQLRGRVMAGVRGDTGARVFCQNFNPELVSIAGVFRVFETVPPELAGQAVQAWLDGDNLRFARIGE